MAITWILTDSLSHLYSNVPIQTPFLMPPALHFYSCARPSGQNSAASRLAELVARFPFSVVILSLTIL